MIVNGGKMENKYDQEIRRVTKKTTVCKRGERGEMTAPVLSPACVRRCLCANDDGVTSNRLKKKRCLAGACVHFKLASTDGSTKVQWCWWCADYKNNVNKNRQEHLFLI